MFWIILRMVLILNPWTWQFFRNGTVNPSGRTVDTYVKDLKQDPTWANFGATNTANNNLKIRDFAGLVDNNDIKEFIAFFTFKLRNSQVIKSIAIS